MKKVLLDTDILSMFLTNNLIVKENINNYLEEYNCITYSILTYYEILSGLKYRDNKKLLGKFMGLSKISEIVPLSIESINFSAEIYSDLRERGITIDDVDILISGICLDTGFALSTNNIKHYQNIKNLEIINWSN